MSSKSSPYSRRTQATRAGLPALQRLEPVELDQPDARADQAALRLTDPAGGRRGRDGDRTRGAVITAGQTTPTRKGKQPRPVWTVSGNLGPFRSLLADLGGSWYRSNVFIWDDPTETWDRALGARGRCVMDLDDEQLIEELLVALALDPTDRAHELTREGRYGAD